MSFYFFPFCDKLHAPWMALATANLGQKEFISVLNKPYNDRATVA